MNEDSKTPDEIPEVDNLDMSNDIAPDDDFSSFEDTEFEDDLSFTEDAGFQDNGDNDFDDLSANPDAEMDYYDESGSKKSNGVNWFNIGIVAFAIISIGGLTYFYLPKLLKSPAQEIAQPQTASPEQQQQLAQQALATETVQDTPSFEGGLLNNPELLEDTNASNTAIEDDGDLFGALDSIKPPSDDEISAILDDITLNNVQVPSAPEQSIIADTTAMPEFDTLPTPADDTMSIDAMDDLNLPDYTGLIEDVPVAAVEPVQQAPIVTESNVSPSEIDAINARLDDMTSSMAQFMDQLDNRLNSISTTTPAVDNSDQFQSLQDMIMRLENKITELEAEKIVAPEPVMEKPQITISDAPAPVADEPKPVVEVAPELTPIPQEPAQVATAPKKKTTPRTRVSNRAFTPPTPKYELRGVSPGQAVIADKGTENLRTVRVGSIVRGLGTIQSIAVENGQWVVRGTSGTVRQ